MIRAILSRYPSPYFPIKVSWKLGGYTYSNVFATVEKARNDILGRYGNVKVIDRTQETVSADKEGR